MLNIPTTPPETAMRRSSEKVDLILVSFQTKTNPKRTNTIKSTVKIRFTILPHSESTNPNPNITKLRKNPDTNPIRCVLSVRLGSLIGLLRLSKEAYQSIVNTANSIPIKENTNILMLRLFVPRELLVESSFGENPGVFSLSGIITIPEINVIVNKRIINTKLTSLAVSSIAESLIKNHAIIRNIMVRIIYIDKRLYTNKDFWKFSSIIT
ncbi:hypothetical protein [Thermococcus kodakarensis]|nr:hypothetical protein [Thermococcus kodakarensis]WCN28714.1 hypothetical protein POG15_03480 [Thermococcus kodakarensis]WCN31012.1 hypothetical protein POG21_03480 [Thermococcus kodakarensis]